MLELQGSNNEELKNHCLKTMICLLFLVVMGITLFYVWLDLNLHNNLPSIKSAKWNEGLFLVLQTLYGDSYNKSQRDAPFLKFLLIKNSTCFGEIYRPSSGASTLYTEQ